MQIWREPDGLAPLEAPWRSLEQEGPLPTGTWTWLQAGLGAFAPGGRLHVVAEDSDGQPTALAPLVVARGSRVGRLEILGLAELSEPADLLGVDDAALVSLAGSLLGSGRPLRLARLPADSPTLPALRRAAGRFGIVRSRPARGCPTLALDESWREPESHLNARRRSDLRRARRKAEALGEVRVAVHTPTPETLAPLLDAVFEVEARSWRAARGGSMAQDPLRGPFFRALAEHAAADGALRLCLLHIDGKPAAMQFALTHGNALWLLKIGYDEAFAKVSPGTILTVESLRHAAAEGLGSYEFLGIREAWTDLWTTEERTCLAVDVYPASLRGIAALVADGTRAVRHRLRRRLSRSKADA